MAKKETIIISLGGSLIAPPEGINWRLLKKFRELIIEQIKKGKRFVIITGGGSTARVYQNAASKAAELTDDDRDWIGIHSTRLNAHLIKTIFRDYAHPRINKNPRTKENLNKHFAKGEGVMVAAGWRPGWSTDYVATILAERLGAKTVINLSNIDYAYTKDPNKFKSAEKLIETDWKFFRTIVGDKWDPGLSAPFDPIASKHAQKLGLEVVIMNGKKLANLKNFLSGKNFKGTTIKD
jgi:uridylate kinase